MADLVVMLTPDVKNHLAENGVFISSGILVEKEDAVTEAIRNEGFEIIEIAEDGEWCAIACRAR